MAKYQFENPLVEEYRGVKVYKYNKLQIRVNPTQMRKIIDAKIDHGMDAKTAIIKTDILIPCNPCTEIQIRKYHDKTTGNSQRNNF